MRRSTRARARSPSRRRPEDQRSKAPVDDVALTIKIYQTHDCERLIVAAVSAQSFSFWRRNQKAVSWWLDGRRTTACSSHWAASIGRAWRFSWTLLHRKAGHRTAVIKWLWHETQTGETRQAL